MVKLLYQNYDGKSSAIRVEFFLNSSYLFNAYIIIFTESFPIVDGSVTSGEIDDVYCLSFVMPNCLLHLSLLSPQEIRLVNDEDQVKSYVREEPVGTFQDLDKDKIYYIYVEEDVEQLVKDQEKMKIVASTMEGAGSVSKPNEKDNLGTESCSCIFGNPCVVIKNRIYSII